MHMTCRLAVTSEPSAEAPDQTPELLDCSDSEDDDNANPLSSELNTDPGCHGSQLPVSGYFCYSR